MYPEAAVSDSLILGIRACFVARFVLPYAPTANDPEVSGRIGIFESAQERINRIVELDAHRFTVNAKHRNASGFQRIKAQWISEIGI